MRVLWLTANYKLVKTSDAKDGYNGGGWVSSLQQLVENDSRIDLGVAYLTTERTNPKTYNGTIYYPIHVSHITFYKKIIKYYGGYKKIDDNAYVKDMQSIIDDFKPDIIHLFGIESPMATILGKTDIPVVVHIQGLLGPYAINFFPNGFNNYSFLFPITRREWLFRNGNIFSNKEIIVRSLYEADLFKKVQYCMGRTSWDYKVTRMMAPDSQYYLVNEVLRNIFYDNAGKWKARNHDRLEITSTLSLTMYKGLDVVLRTAAIMQSYGYEQFVWNIVGIPGRTDFVRFFERQVGVCSKDVNINYLGIMDEQQLCNQMLQSDVYVHPSYIDNSPNSVCEAQMLGLPVIATYVGGIPSLIEDGKTGILIPSNGCHELAYTLIKYKNNQGEFERVALQGGKGARVRHDKNDIIDSLYSSYKKIIG